MVKEETRKGPWTEQEDMQLIFFVGLFGDRRWDAIAKASGLHRTGKSCRLRWVNYLRPGLKRGRMTPQEERLILDLHSRWGNRWSRIARRLPGRTDNEIKNYWRTHTRKKAQERKRGSSPSLSASSSSSCLLDELPRVDAGVEMAEPRDPGSPPTTAPWEGGHENAVCGFPMMEQIWNEIASSQMSGLTCYGDQYIDEACNQLPCSPVLASQPWDYSCVDTLWKMDDEELKMLLPPGDHVNSSAHQHVIRESAQDLPT